MLATSVAWMAAAGLLTAITVVAPAQGLSPFTGARGFVTTIAGTGEPGYANDVVATAAAIGPGVAAQDAYGNTYLAEPDACTIRRIDRAGMITVLAGVPGTCRYDGDGDAATHHLVRPAAVAMNAEGTALLVGDGCLLRKLDLSTAPLKLTTVAGAVVDGAPVCTWASTIANQFGRITRIVVRPAGELVVADPGHCTIRKLKPFGPWYSVTTLAGRGVASGACQGFTPDGASGAQTLLQGPGDVAVDRAGNVLYAEPDHHVVRQLSATTGLVTTVAGLAGAPGDVDGPVADARLDTPASLAVDPVTDELFIADAGSCRVRVLAAGALAPAAGTGTCTDDPPGAARPVAPAQLPLPRDGVGGLSFTPSGSLLLTTPGRLREWIGASRPTAAAGDDPGVNLFLRTNGDAGGGWKEGDATYTLLLADGRVLWFFADSFLGGTVDPATRALEGASFVNNQVLVQDTPTSPGMVNAPSPQPAFFRHPDHPDRVLWPAAAVQSGPDTVQVLLRHYDGVTIAGMELGTIDLRDWSVTYEALPAAMPVPTNCPEAARPARKAYFGTAIATDETSSYIYGIEYCAGRNYFGEAYIKVARVDGRDLTGAWTYWNGTDFGATDSAAATNMLMADGRPFTLAGGEYSVVRDLLAPPASRYRLVTTVLGYGSIQVFTAPAPTGPWTQVPGSRTMVEATKPAYRRVPGSECVLLTYGGKEHPELQEVRPDGSRQISISYNVNVIVRTGGSVGCVNRAYALQQLLAHADNYRPRFITWILP